METLKPGDSISLKEGPIVNMATEQTDPTTLDVVDDSSSATSPLEAPVSNDESEKATENINGEAQVPSTPTYGLQKALPKEPVMTPRIKKKVPWKGKNIMVLLPRDDQRGQPGKAAKPLRQQDIKRMFASWEELGYPVDGFDLLVEGYQPPGTSDSQSRSGWPSADDVAHERSERKYQVTLPDLNAWKNYVNELQEAKLRALGVSFANEEPEQPISPPTTNPSRQASAQYPPLPFSPPVPTSSASSNHAMPGYPFPQQFAPGLSGSVQSPGIPTGASPVPFGAVQGKFGRQSISLPPGSSPFQLPQQSPQGWAGAIPRNDSPSLMSLNGLISPHSPFGADGFQAAQHLRQQSLQYPILQHQMQQQQSARASPRLHEVAEVDEEDGIKSPSKTPEPPKQNPDSLQAEIDEAEYHLEEQLRNQLEHKDYNPETQAEQPAATGELPAQGHDRQASGGFPVPEHFANEPSESLVLHHPRPHSRGHSLTQKFFHGPEEEQEAVTESALKPFAPMEEIPEPQKADDAYEIETNPSNLGTPVQNFDFSAPFGQHGRSTSKAGSFWDDSTSTGGRRSRRPSHESRPSLSKLNVKAPEFKFNPTNTFTPGVFNLSGNDNNLQTAALQASVNNVAEQTTSSIPQFGSPEFNGNASSLNPGQSDFNFSTDGPKFRPDAPPFMPIHPVSGSVTSTTAPGLGLHSSKGSIFGNIDIKADEIVKPSKKNKAIPIVRPSSRASALSVKLSPAADDELDDNDGRVADDSRVKRAKSSAPEGDDEPLFAQRPEDSATPLVAPAETATEVTRDAEDLSAEGEAAVTLDTSMSSITSPGFDTQASTAAPSETSPPSQKTRYATFFKMGDTKIESINFKHSAHNKSLSATAAPFLPGTSVVADDEEPAKDEEIAEPSPLHSTVPSQAVSPLEASVPPSPPSQPTKDLVASPPAKPKGLAASRFAVQEAAPVRETSPHDEDDSRDVVESVETEPAVEPETEEVKPAIQDLEPTLAEIDAVMEELNNDPSKGVAKSVDPVPWEAPVPPEHSHQPSEDAPLVDLASPTPRPQHQIPLMAAQPVMSTDLEDPFVDQPSSPHFRGPANELLDGEPESALMSDWEAAFPDDEQDKVESRAQFFDGRVNEVVGNLLASRLQPLEKTLFSIQDALASRSLRPASSRRDMRSLSADLQESDADDEDDEPAPRRSLSPRKDRKMEHIRAAVMEALATHQQIPLEPAVTEQPVAPAEESALLKAIEDMKTEFGTSLRLDFRGEDLRNIVEEAVERRMPPTPQPDIELSAKSDGLQAKIIDLEQRLYAEREKCDKEIADRRAADDASAELNRQLQAAETRVEVEIINRSVFDQRVADLEEKMRHQEARTEEEVNMRRAAEDRLSENQRLLRIASEEEARLREVVEEREQKIKEQELSSGKTSMRMVLLEAAQTNHSQSQSEMTNKINVLEADLKAVRQDNHYWRAEAERTDEMARSKGGELAHVIEENRHFQKSLNTMATQLEENERLRESWRAKFLSLQDDMGKAAREVAEENARRIKKDQAMLARHEVLDARLQAEAKTRERLEVEMERLQMNERTGMRAVNECKRLEDLLGEMRTENHHLQETAARHQREFEEARESGASEVKRTRLALQTELDSANHQVNVIREELEEHNSKLRGELDNVKLDFDTAKARNEMLLEEANATKNSELEEQQLKHQNELEDVSAKYERQLSNAMEDGQKTEEHLLERLSISSSKIEHLQDRIVHLEDKLEIAKQAAAAAAQAAKSAGVDPGPEAAHIARPTSRKLDLPEKVSPQALRESIMVLQEQLQAREQRIEELEQTVSKLDPDAPTKISKRDDEITWLRELLAVRHGDLQDIITALSGDAYDRHRVKDAAIRLKANLQMEEQERERAMNGGSAINLPNIAQSLQAATPRVAQAVGAAWGNWRKGSQPSLRSISGVLSSPAAGSNDTPSRRHPGQQNNLLGGLLTPPASGLRQPSPEDSRSQPTAFSATGRRFASQGHIPSRPRGPATISHLAGKMPAPPEPQPHQQEDEEPQTPPMAASNSYDSDAQLEDFDDHGFFNEE